MLHANHGKGSLPCIVLIFAVFLVFGSDAAPAYPDRTSGRGSSADSASVDSTDVAAGDSMAESLEPPSNPRIGIVLEKGGEIVIELFSHQAPLAVERILSLAGEGFYDGLKFHRVESYLVQTGRKESELPPVEGEMFGQSIRHEAGMVGMARLPDDYDSAVTQFYIMKEHRPRLNGEYTLFGRVVEGMDFVNKIKKGWKIEKISVLP